MFLFNLKSQIAIIVNFFYISASLINALDDQDEFEMKNSNQQNDRGYNNNNNNRRNENYDANANGGNRGSSNRKKLARIFMFYT